MTAHHVELTSNAYPITSDSWIMSVDGKPPQVPSKAPVYAHNSDTISFTVKNNVHGVTFASNGFCAAPGTAKPTSQCSPDFSQGGSPQALVVHDNGSGGSYYYVIKFNNDNAGKPVGPLDPIVINNKAAPMAFGLTRTEIEIIAAAVVIILLILFAWRRFGSRPT